MRRLFPAVTLKLTDHSHRNNYKIYYLNFVFSLDTENSNFFFLAPFSTGEEAKP